MPSYLLAITKPLLLARLSEHFRQEKRADWRSSRSREGSYPSFRYFSPASIRVFRMFCSGGSGQVVNSENAQGGL